MAFSGFSEDISNHVIIPEQFFRQVLLEIDDLAELQLTLYIFWRFEHIEGAFRYIRLSDLLRDENLVQSLGGGPRKTRKILEQALQKAAARGTLLQAEIPPKQRRDKLICINSSKGRAVIHALERGERLTLAHLEDTLQMYAEHPNIFQLYEAHIGPLTPLIADALRDAEKTYQASWIEEAFRIAVERNKRSFNYIEAILHRWQEGGRDVHKKNQDRRNTEKTRRRYSDWEK
ncbi:MAG: DnaD domain-containing protein [Acidobacteriaceae bacterium]